MSQFAAGIVAAKAAAKRYFMRSTPFVVGAASSGLVFVRRPICRPSCVASDVASDGFWLCQCYRRWKTASASQIVAFPLAYAATAVVYAARLFRSMLHPSCDTTHQIKRLHTGLLSQCRLSAIRRTASKADGWVRPCAKLVRLCACAAIHAAKRLALASQHQ